jgi:oligopeptide transport system permease protein
MEEREHPTVKLQAPEDVTPSVGMWRGAWKRLRRNPEGVFGMVVIVLFILVTIFADQIAPFGIKDINLGDWNLPPAWVAQDKLGVHGNPRYLLGTDQLGRDLLTRAIYGARTSMTLGIVSAPLIGLIGMLVGLVSGYAGGRVDRLIMRVTDIFYAFPPLMICIMTVLALNNTALGVFLNGIVMLFIAFLSVGWAGAARLMRSSVLGIMHMEYIEAARCLGVPSRRMMFRHLLPNCVGPLLVWVTLMVPQLILTEAILAYLGITPGQRGGGTGMFNYSWGGMILEGRSLIHVHPNIVLIPAVCVGLISIAFTFFGDALRDAIDPATRK